MDGAQWRKDFETVTRAVLCGATLVVCFYVAFFGQFPEGSVKIATGFIGLILGYYLK
jgi:hypothetical protein